jgi:HK97 family phage major capsid protein/HK97 family phage prohead protease
MEALRMPEIKRRALSLDVRAISDEGIIEGIAARWGEEDAYGDILQRGAFSDTLVQHRANGTFPAMLWLHAQPCGVWEAIEERDDGLYVRGRFALDTDTGQQAYRHAKSGTTTGLSIGFFYDKWEPGPNGALIVLSVELHEISLTPIPAAPRARITNVRSIQEPTMDPENQNQNENQNIQPAAEVVELRSQVAELRTTVEQLEIRSQRPGRQQEEQPSEQRAAFGTYLRFGNGTPAEQIRALTVSSDPNGGYLAPAEMSTEFLRDLVEFSPVRSVASVRSTSAPSVSYPKRTSGTNAKWKGETQAQEESTVTFGQAEIPVHEINTFVDISNQLLADSAGQAEAEVRMALAEDFGKKEGAAFVNGDGVLSPKGFMSETAIAHTVNGHATILAADPLITLLYAQPAAYRNSGAWGMNGSTLATIRKLKDGAGNYLWQPSYQAGQPETILGRPVVEMVDMPDIADGAFPVIYGDFQAYRIVDRVGLSILVNPYLLATNGITRIHATRRVGGGVLQAARFRKLKMAVA